MAIRRNTLPMHYEHWAHTLKDGESVTLGDDTSQIFSNASLAGRKAGAVYINDKLLVALHPEHSPNAFLRPKCPYDRPTKVSVKGGAVDVMGYSMRAVITYDTDSEEEVAEAIEQPPAKAKTPEAVPAKSPKAAAAKSPKAEAKKPEPKKKKVEFAEDVKKAQSPKQEAKKPEPKKKEEKKALAVPAAVTNGQYVPTRAPVPNNAQFARHLVDPEPEHVSDDEVDVGVELISLRGEEYYHDVRSHKVYQGPMDDAVFKGYYNPHMKCVQDKPPAHRDLNPFQVEAKAKQQAKRSREEMRKQWEEEHGDDSDVTMDSEDERPAKKARK